VSADPTVPTRRRIMKLLAAAVATAVAAPVVARQITPPGSTNPARPRWIGHC
jgi:hypothetical protein